MSKKYILVTGAAGGIGKEIVKTLISSGFTVIAGVMNEDEEASLSSLDPSKVIPVMLNLTDEDTINAAMKYIRILMGEGTTLFALINNAGFNVNAPLSYMTTNEIGLTVKVNLLGTILMTRAVLPLMASGSRVIMISSATAFMASPIVATYAATKAGIEALADGLRLEFEPRGIKVIAVEPGVVKTPMTSSAPMILQKKLEEMTTTDRQHYEGMMTKIVNMSHGANVGMEPVKVARVIAKALTVEKPKARYTVGLDAKIAHIFRYMPSFIRDFIQRKIVGL